MTIVDEVIEAIAAVCNPSTSNEQRKQYTKALEEFRHDSAADILSEIGFTLVSKPDETLALVGWNFIDDVVRYKWNNVPVEFRLEMRSKLMQQLESCLQENMVDSISKSIVAMMEHEWPQNWTELMPQLDEISRISALHCSAVFAILKRLVENVVTLMTIQNAQRRRDMYNGIVVYMPDIIKMALDRLDALSGPELPEIGYRTITYILQWLIETCEWVPSTAISPHLNRMVDSLIRHLNTVEKNIYELASRSLAALAERKKETSEECIVVSAFFREEVIAAILQTVRLAGESSETNSSHYSYLKALCGLLTSLGSHLAKVWSEKEPPQNFSTYLSALSQIFSHPSLLLKVEALESIYSLSTHHLLGKSQEFHRELENVLDRILVAIEKNGYPSQKPVSLAVHYSNMDYDDDLEWSNDLKKLREKARSVVNFSLDNHYPRLLQILDQDIFQPIVNNLSSIPQAKWEPMQIIAKVIVQGGFDKDLITEASRDGLMAMGDGLIQLMSRLTDWDLLSEVLSVHSSLLIVFKYHAIGLKKYIELLQWTLISSNNHAVLNRHAGSLVLRVVSLFPDFFKLNVKLIMDLYSAVQPKITHMQIAQLIQVFAILSNIVDSDEEKIELLRMCISPAIEYFSKWQSCFDNVEEFVKFNGFDLPPSRNLETEERDDIKRRKDLRCYLTTIEGIFQQITDTSPLGRVEEVVLYLFPVFFKLNRVIFELNSPSGLAKMDPGYQKVSDIPRGEREAIYCSVGESLEITLGKLEAERKDTVELSKQYIQQIHIQCVNIIALMAQKFGVQLHSHPSATEFLLSTVELLEHIPAFRIRYWIKKTWRFLITSAPQDRWEQLRKFLEILVSHMKERLEQMWKTVAAVDYDAEPTEAELFNEHMTCVLSREYLVFLRMVILGPESVNEAVTPLSEWLFREQIGLVPIMELVFSALTWRDTQASTKAIPLCKAFVDKLALNYDDNTAMNIFIQELNSLQIHGSDEMAGSALLTLVAHTYITLRKFSDSFPKILLQVPGVSESDVATFDLKIKPISTGEEILSEKLRRVIFRKLLQEIISVSTSELHKRPVYLRPLPPIEKRRKEESTPEYEAVAILFGN